MSQQKRSTRFKALDFSGEISASELPNGIPGEINVDSDSEVEYPPYPYHREKVNDGDDGEVGEIPMVAPPSSTNPNKPVVKFSDHYSLGRSTELRFRGKKDQTVYVLDNAGMGQLVMVMETNQDETVKASTTTTTTTTTTTIQPVVHAGGSFGASLLRTIAFGVSLFVLTVWFAFSIQCIFFLFMNVVGTYTPSEWTANPPLPNLLGCVFACPVLVDSLAKILTMSLACTVDCWRGIGTHPSSLWKTNARLGNHSEWPTLVIFFGIPVLALLGATLDTRTRDAVNDASKPIEGDGTESPRGWYELTMLSWACGVGIFQILYMELCHFNEMGTCHKLLQKYKGTTSLWGSLRVNLLLTQRQKYSGMRRERYLVENKDDDPGGEDAPAKPSSRRTEYYRDASRDPVQWNYRFGTRWTKLLCCCYDNLEVAAVTADAVPSAAAAAAPPAPANGEDPPPQEEKIATADTSCGAKRNYTMDEVFGNIRFETKYNWSLEQLWFKKPQRMNYLTVVTGASRVMPSQFLIGYICVASAIVLVILSLAGFLVWFGQSWQMIVLIIVFVVAFCFFPMLVSLYKMREHQKSKGRSAFDSDSDSDVVHDVQKITTNPSDEDNLPAAPSKTGSSNDGFRVVLSVWESVRVTELKEWACYATAVIEILAFFVWPLISLFYYENTHIGIVFLVLGIHMVPRHYFNASHFLQEVGPINDLDMSDLDMTLFPSASRKSVKIAGDRSEATKEKRDVKNKMIVANLLRRVTRSPAKTAWIRTLLFAFFVSFVAYNYASGEEVFSENDGFVMGRYRWKGIVLADDFYWDAQPQLQYPTCDVQKGFSIPGASAVDLADFSFLGILSFASPVESQPLLDQWFGNGTVIDDFEYVSSYKTSIGMEDHPVEYKLFTLASDPTSAVVAIRGSEARWDWLVDIQLWSGGVLAQGIKNFNPLGYLWDPILDEVVYLINFVQSNKLKELSYYRFTSDFIEALYNGYGGRVYDNLRVTGVSLGGGLSILTGAITGASAVSFSGLNAMFSRRTFLPPITEDQLNTRVFNTIPQRDLIAQIDKPGLLHQRIQCTAPKQNFLMGCHSMFRTLCEIQYKCGSRGRPINCACTSLYGYPEPTQNGNVTWAEACSRESKAPGME